MDRARPVVYARGAGIVAGLLVLAATATAQETTTGDAAAGRLRSSIEASRERVGEHEREERNLLERLEEVDRSMDTLRSDVQRSEQRAAKAQAELARVDERLTQARQRLASTRRAMSVRAVALYKSGAVGPLRVLFSSSSLQQMLSKVGSLERLLEYDAGLIARFSSEVERLQTVEREAERSAGRRDAARATLREHSQALRAERAAKRELLAMVRSDRSRERALLVELERSARVLEETLSGLSGVGAAEGTSLDGSGFAARRGSVNRPVRGRIQQSFGRVVDEEYQTVIFRKGVEFAAASGDSVRAVARGRIRFAGWFRGYGKIVIVDHGDDYFTVSGHLADIFVEVGDLVGENDTLGTVGETGSLSGPSLYFEVREGGSPLDPAEWLANG